MGWNAQVPGAGLRLLRAVPAVLVASLLAAGCSSQAGHPAGAAARFGPAGAIGPAPTITLPASAAGVSLSVSRTAQRITPGNDALWGMDQQLGTAFHVAISRETPGATVRFLVDPGKVARLIKADGGSAADLFVELYEPELGMWLPLRSSYDRSSHTVSAVAPHLSTITLGWVVTHIAQTVFPGIPITPLALTYAKFAESFAHEMREALFPPQGHDACGKVADKNWNVLPQISSVSGCVSTHAGNDLLMENHLLVPLDITQPPGAARASLLLQDVSHDSFPQFVDRGLVWVGGGTLLPGHGAAVTPLNASDLAGTGIEVPTAPDLNLIRVDAALALLAVIPAEKEWELALDEAEGPVVSSLEAEQATTPGSVDDKSFVDTLLTAINTKVKAVPKLPPIFADVDAVDTIIECAFSGKDAVQKVADAKPGELTDAVFDGLVAAAESCFQDELDNVSEQLHTVVSAILAAPHLAEQAREAVQLEKLGRFSLLPSQTQVVPAGLSHPVPANEFVTGGGSIECANFDVDEHLITGQPLRQRDPSKQLTSCFVKNYTGPVPDQPCVGLPEFTVFLAPGQYPTAYKCSGEFPKALTPSPYQLADGHSVDLGGATCLAAGPGVTCYSNSSDGISFTLSRTGITIPVAGTGEVEFPSAAGVASAGVFRPSALNISADSSLIISDVHYSSWTKQHATGTGILNACTPGQGCLSGHRTHTKVTFTLDTPVLACGKFFFTKLTWQATAGDTKPVPFKLSPPVFNNFRQEKSCDVLIGH